MSYYRSQFCCIPRRRDPDCCSHSGPASPYSTSWNRDCSRMPIISTFGRAAGTGAEPGTEPSDRCLDLYAANSQRRTPKAS